MPLAPRRSGFIACGWTGDGTFQHWMAPAGRQCRPGTRRTERERDRLLEETHGSFRARNHSERRVAARNRPAGEGRGAPAAKLEAILGGHGALISPGNRAFTFPAIRVFSRTAWC